ncbi:MAG: hypothetical protein WCK84_09600 [Bacteroidota bacterium]
MDRIAFIFVILALSLVSCSSNKVKKGLPVRSGDYLGQTLPSDRPYKFAGGIISTGMYERDISITADGNEIYYSLYAGDWITIMVARRIKGTWFEPVVAEFARDTSRFFAEPSISADGQRILFLSAKPGWADQHIWMAERNPGGSWGKPIHLQLPSPIDTSSDDFYPSLAKNGNLYFSRRDNQSKTISIQFSKWKDGKFSAPEPLPPPVNGKGMIYNAGIAPDESFLVACVAGRDSLNPNKAATYMLFFHNPDGSWSNGIDMIETLHMPCNEAISISVSPDGTYIFYASAKRSLPFKSFAPDWKASNFHRMRNLDGNGNSDIFWFNFKKVMFRL